MEALSSRGVALNDQFRLFGILRTGLPLLDASHQEVVHDVGAVRGGLMGGVFRGPNSE